MASIFRRVRGAWHAADGETKARQQSREATGEAERAGAEREARESYQIREEEIERGFPKSLLTDLKDRVTL